MSQQRNSMSHVLALRSLVEVLFPLYRNFWDSTLLDFSEFCNLWSSIASIKLLDRYQIISDRVLVVRITPYACHFPAVFVSFKRMGNT